MNMREQPEKLKELVSNDDKNQKSLRNTTGVSQTVIIGANTTCCSPGETGRTLFRTFYEEKKGDSEIIL